MWPELLFWDPAALVLAPMLTTPEKNLESKKRGSGWEQEHEIRRTGWTQRGRASGLVRLEPPCQELNKHFTSFWGRIYSGFSLINQIVALFGADPLTKADSEPNPWLVAWNPLKIQNKKDPNFLNQRPQLEQMSTRGCMMYEIAPVDSGSSAGTTKESEQAWHWWCLVSPCNTCDTCNRTRSFHFIMWHYNCRHLAQPQSFCLRFQAADDPQVEQ